jgi:RNA polymerase sigma-70 factor (ECF subfamily)
MITSVDPTSLDEAAAAARPRLLAIAYRMLGSMTDAEDVVQDALLKAHRAAPSDLEAPVAYLTTLTTRTAIDHLRSARVRRETYPGPWLPEPVAEDPAPDASAPALLADSLSMAFLVVLESLGPEERAALLLHDVFGYSHAEMAEVLDRSEGASRQLLRRARQRIVADRPRFDVDLERRDRLVQQFRAACEGGDLDSFLAVLADDATLVSDGGGVVTAARRPVVGADRVARFLAKVLTRGRVGRDVRTVTVNGQPALAFLSRGRLTLVAVLDPAPDGLVGTILFVVNPAKLAHVRAGIEPG